MNTESNTLGSVGSIRIVIAGDGATGKTCLMYAYVKNQFLPNYEPTTFDQNHVEVTINRDKYTVMTRVGLTNTMSADRNSRNFQFCSIYLFSQFFSNLFYSNGHRRTTRVRKTTRASLRKRRRFRAHLLVAMPR